MLRRTHLALGLAIGLYFVSHIKSNKWAFLAIVLISSVLPDIESGFSAPKRHRLLSFQQTKWVFHRNFLIHTYTILIPLTIVFTFFYPTMAFPFFLGYSFHLFLDTFSPQGIRPFWPLKGKSTGSIVPGGRIDKVLFYVFVIFDFALLVKLFI
ncbi:MAG: metal-dependent hydrolase [Nanoarchaeota archaeon]|nr:metal-dependent hydrolase [Nanoarchaeota archaeon]MBU1051379.1 metal-dependent hydrolase [Nanoarchaeota archaeon]